MTIKTKEFASLLTAFIATAIIAAVMIVYGAQWWMTLTVSLSAYILIALATLLIIRKYVAYKLKPIYSIVLSRDVHTGEIVDELRDKHVENISEELTAWATDNDKEISRLKDIEKFRKQYLGNVAHELKTPIFNIQGYISTLLDGGLEDELINRKYLERTEKSIDRLINIVSDLDTISKLENDMTRLNFENFDIVALAKEIADQNEIEAQRHAIKINVKYSDSLPSSFRVAADKHYVGQVLVNLIVNSIRYGRSGRRRDQRQVPRHARQDTDRGRGQRRRHRQGGHKPRLRALLPCRQEPFARAGRHGSGSGHSQTYHRGTRRAHYGTQRKGRGHDIRLHAEKEHGRSRLTPH